MEESTVRENLMSEKYYTPYCGADMCNGRWPRTVKSGDQYKCPYCHWLSEFPQDFIDRYKKRWSLNSSVLGLLY